MKTVLVVDDEPALGLGEGYFLLLILDRDKGSLARAQLDLVAIERDLVERVSSW